MGELLKKMIAVGGIGAIDTHTHIQIWVDQHLRSIHSTVEQKMAGRERFASTWSDLNKQMSWVLISNVRTGIIRGNRNKVFNRVWGKY